MPVRSQLSGVYVEELPARSAAIAGVATSLAAFIGWAARGATDQPVLVQSWTEFQGQFGGLDSRSYLGYAVQAFFLNGGQQAYVVRLIATSDGAAVAASHAAVGGSLSLFARSVGAWGNAIAVAIGVATDANHFGLHVSLNGELVESFADLSITPGDPRFVVSVIESSSQYITFVDPATKAAGATPSMLPAISQPMPLQGGDDGRVLVPAADGGFEDALTGDADAGVYLLNGAKRFNLLCVPGETDVAAIAKLQEYCALRRAFYLVDAPQSATVSPLASAGPLGTALATGTAPLVPLQTSALASTQASSSAYYFPWVSIADPLANNQPALVPPCGFVAGVYAATDAARGVWKAPAGTSATLSGALGLQYTLSDQENGELNPRGINCLRQFQRHGFVVWGARTLEGSDQAASEWKYVPVRRLALYIEASLYEGTQWAMFEPNGEVLWGQIRLSVGAWMQSVFVQGAFQGSTPQQAYFVRCDATNNPPSSVEQGIVNIEVGFAPLSPAEFVVLQIQQIAAS